MAKVFNFQMPVIYVMFKSTIWVVSMTTTAYFKYITQLRSWAKTIFVQNKNICQFVQCLADQIPYASNEVYGNRISGPFLQLPLFTSHMHKDSTRGSVHRLISLSLNTYLSLFVHLIVGFQQ